MADKLIIGRVEVAQDQQYIVPLRTKPEAVSSYQTAIRDLINAAHAYADFPTAGTLEDLKVAAHAVGRTEE